MHLCEGAAAIARQRAYAASTAAASHAPPDTLRECLAAQCPGAKLWWIQNKADEFKDYWTDPDKEDHHEFFLNLAQQAVDTFDGRNHDCEEVERCGSYVGQHARDRC